MRPARTDGGGSSGAAARLGGRPWEKQRERGREDVAPHSPALARSALLVECPSTVAGSTSVEALREEVGRPSLG